MNKSYALGILVKPKVLVAMLALYAIGYITSYASEPGTVFNVLEFILGLTAVGMAVAGANALNCYLDRDIDRVMVRTRGRIEAIETAGNISTLGVSLSFLLVSSAISVMLGMISFILYAIGSGFYLIAYTALLKRRTALNVLFTAPSVASPVWFGWYLGGSPLYPTGLLMGLLVAIWGPLHLWSLAYVFSKDYSNVEVPMMPNVLSRSIVIKIILASLLALVTFSYVLVPYSMSPFYVVGITFINALFLAAGLFFHREKTNALGYLIFKLTAPYIILILLTFTFDQFLF